MDPAASVALHDGMVKCRYLNSDLTCVAAKLVMVAQEAGDFANAAPLIRRWLPDIERPIRLKRGSSQNDEPARRSLPNLTGAPVPGGVYVSHLCL